MIDKLLRNAVNNITGYTLVVRTNGNSSYVIDGAFGEPRECVAGGGGSKAYPALRRQQRVGSILVKIAGCALWPFKL